MNSAHTTLFWLVLFLLASRAVFAAAPVAIDDSRTISLGSSLTVNVLANDFDEDGDSFTVIEVTNGEFGTTQINEDGSILYTPTTNSGVTDVFTYTIQDDSEAAETASATVTVTILDNAYANLDLNPNFRSVAQVFADYCSNLRSLSDAEAGEVRREMVGICAGVELLAQRDASAAANVLGQIAPEETLSMLRNSLDSGRSQSGVVSQRIARIQSGGPAISFNGQPLLSRDASGGAAGDEETLWSAFGVFISAQIESAEREQSDLENGYDSEGSSLTLGVDYRLSANTVFGAAVGFSNSTLEYVNNAGEFDTTAETALLFGAWTFGAFSLESQLGYSSLSFDSERYILYGDGQRNIDVALTSETKGTQNLLSVQGQWEWNRNALSLFPYLRVDAQENDIQGYEEFGGGGYAIGIEDQKATQITLSTGVQGTYAMSYNWGVLIPNFELSLLSEVESDRGNAVGYFVFDTEESNKFTLLNDGGDSSFYQIGLGASAVMKRGVSSFIQYRHVAGYQYFSRWQLQAGLRFEF